MRKKVALFILTGAFGLAALLLSIRFIINEIIIKKYEQAEFDATSSSFLATVANILEPYVSYYNYGNVLYHQGEYDEAISMYKSALDTVPEDKYCKVEVNLVLSRIASEKELDESLIQSLQSELTNKQCATKDNTGKDRDAQTLYNELENAQRQSDTTEEKNDDKEEDNEEETELEKKLQEEQVDSNNSQKQAEEMQQELNGGYSYYDGKIW